jgi:hypothetical protein
VRIQASTLRWLIVLVSLLCSRVLHAQTYAVVDSIEIHGLTFLGKVEHHTYNYADSVRCQFMVANRSQEPFTFQVSFQCEALFTSETWCDSSGTSWNCPPPEPFLIPCAGPGRPYEVIISPGEHVIETRTFASRQPEASSWWFYRGWAIFVTPWPDYSPYFEFAIPYYRVRSTQVSQVSWSIIKVRYR